jgi:hypothetical protein
MLYVIPPQTIILPLIMLYVIPPQTIIIPLIMLYEIPPQTIILLLIMMYVIPPQTIIIPLIMLFNTTVKKLFSIFSIKTGTSIWKRANGYSPKITQLKWTLEAV